MKMKRGINDFKDFQRFSDTVKQEHAKLRNRNDTASGNKEWNFTTKGKDEDATDFSIQMQKKKTEILGHPLQKHSENKLHKFLQNMLNSIEGWSQHSTQDGIFGAKFKEAQDILKSDGGHTTLNVANRIIILIEEGLNGADAALKDKSAQPTRRRTQISTQRTTSMKPDNIRFEVRSPETGRDKVGDFLKSLATMSSQISDATKGYGDGLVPHLSKPRSSLSGKNAKPMTLDDVTISNEFANKTSLDERKAECHKFIDHLQMTADKILEKNKQIVKLPDDIKKAFKLQSTSIHEGLSDLQKVYNEIAKIRREVDKTGFLPPKETQAALKEISVIVAERSESLTREANTAENLATLVDWMQKGDFSDLSVSKAYSTFLDPDQQKQYDQIANSPFFKDVFNTKDSNPFSYGLKVPRGADEQTVENYGKMRVMKFLLSPAASAYIKKHDIPAHEAFAIHVYSCECYTEMNSVLNKRRFDKTTMKLVPYPEKEMPKGVHKANKLAKAGLRKLPGVTATPCYRGVNLTYMPKEEADLYQTPGSVINVKQFTSTSPIVGFDLPCVLVISPLAGEKSGFKYIRPLSNSPHENEALGEPDIKLLVMRSIDHQSLNNDQKAELYKQIAPDLTFDQCDNQFYTVDRFVFLNQVD